MRNVGGIGENTLALWAEQVGITPNKVSQDRTGWDFLLEFPCSHQASLYNGQPLDRSPFPLRCFVQVKSTDKGSGKWHVKLTNWERLIKNPLPAFFLVLEFDSQDSCQRAFLVHVGEEYIRRVQKRLREHAQNAALHKKTLQFKYTPDDSLPSLDGRGLEDAILRHVGGKPEDYASRKIGLVNSVGYEGKTGRFQFTLSLPSYSNINIQEYLVDFSIGLVPHLEVTSGEFKDVRFGIASQLPSLSFSQGGRLFVDHESAGSAAIRISTPDDKAELRIDTETYLPHGLGFKIDREYLKMRLAAPFFSVILRSFRDNAGKFHFDLPKPDVEYALKDIHTVAALILFLHDASKRYDHARFEVRFNSALLGTGTIPLTKPLDENIIRYATSIRSGWNLAKYFDIQHNLRLKPSELLRQYGQLLFMDPILGINPRWIKITFWSDADLRKDGKIFCVPIATNVVIGQHRVAVAVAILGHPSPTGQFTDDSREFEITTLDTKLCRKHLYNRSEGLRHPKQELIDSVIQEYENSADILIIDNF